MAKFMAERGLTWLGGGAEADMTAAIRCAGLVKRYRDVTALDGLDLEVEPGQVFGFLGPNGTGKPVTGL